MRNPNGYGSVYKLAGKRRKPYGVRKTIRWDDNGKQIFRNIGYYKTRPEAILALAEFNVNPYDIEVSSITFADVNKKWSAEKFSKISHSNVNGYIAAFKISESLHDMKFVDIKKAHLQAVIDNCEKGHGTLRKIKVLFNQLFKYAMGNDIIIKDYSKFVEIGEDDTESTRKPFTQEEIQLLWDNVNRLDFIDTVLIMIYTGLRPGELITIETSNIDIKNHTIRGGIKTRASKNRIIPINHKIFSMVNKKVSEGHEYMIVNNDDKQMSYFTYYDCKFKLIMEQLHLSHKPHDCRHTFATLMDNAGANKLCVKRIMGHASQDITDKVYTHKDLEELKKAIELI
jgi:integrase